MWAKIHQPTPSIIYKPSGDEPKYGHPRIGRDRKIRIYPAQECFHLITLGAISKQRSVNPTPLLSKSSLIVMMDSWGNFILIFLSHFVEGLFFLHLIKQVFGFAHDKNFSCHRAKTVASEYSWTSNSQIPVVYVYNTMKREFYWFDQ